MLKKIVLGVSAISLIAVTNSNALVIDFEEISNSGGSYVFSGYSLDTQGFNFLNSQESSEAILHWGASDPFNADPGGVTYSHNYANKITTVTQINGDLFDLTSLDIGNVYNNSPYSQSFYFTGLTGVGASLSQSFTSDQLGGLETVTLNWVGLKSFTFTETIGSYLQADNFVINEGSDQNNPVPEPTTMLLFGAGLAGLIGSKTRRKK